MGLGSLLNVLHRSLKKKVVKSKTQEATKKGGNMPLHVPSQAWLWTGLLEGKRN